MYYKNVIKQMIADGVVPQEAAEKYCPELKESEDERIIKSLIGHLKECRNNTRSEVMIGEYARWIAWLEKQKGTKRENEGNSLLQSEQKPVDDKDAEKASEEYRDFRMSCGIKDPIILNEIEEAYYEGAIRKHKTAWSEEDETRIKSIIALLKEPAVCAMDGNKGIIEANIKYLKSLKNRVLPQPKQEWSEEDERILNGLISSLARIGANTRTDSTSINYTFSREIDWLKSLRPQKHWKPSDEQIEALESATENCAYSEYQDYLRELIKQLKKLREK